MNDFSFDVLWMESFRLDDLKKSEPRDSSVLRMAIRAPWPFQENKKPCPPSSEQGFWKNSDFLKLRLRRRPVRLPCECRIAFNFAGHVIAGIPLAAYKARPTTLNPTQTDHPVGGSHRRGANENGMQL